MKKIAKLWSWLSHRSFISRLIIKLLLFLFVFLLVTFPNPALNIKQLNAYRDTESLFNTDFPELDHINAEIDSLLASEHTFEDEYKTIVRYVYEKIPYQFDIMEKGGTDSGAIHLHRQGVPNLVIGVPTRHIHSHAGIIHRDDFDSAVQLVSAVIRKLDRKTVARLTT